jgi:hypothetical protein
VAPGNTVGNLVLSNIYLNIEAVSINDGHFFNSIQNFLADNGAYVFTWKSWYHQVFMSNGWGYTSQNPHASACMNRILMWFTDSLASGAIDTVTHQSNMYTRLGNGIDEWYIMFSGKPYPGGCRVKVNDPAYSNALAYVFNELSLSQDLVMGIDPAVTSNAVFITNFFFIMHNFCCEETDGENWLSGKETRGQTTPINVVTVAQPTVNPPANPLSVHTFIECTTQMIVKAGQQFDLVL